MGTGRPQSNHYTLTNVFQKIFRTMTQAKHFRISEQKSRKSAKKVNITSRLRMNLHKRLSIQH